jgi:hypothetical protein
MREREVGRAWGRGRAPGARGPEQAGWVASRGKNP